MSVQPWFSIMCDGYQLARALGLSEEAANEVSRIGECTIYSHTRGGQLRASEANARADVDAAGWTQREFAGGRGPRTYDLCPTCTPRLDELMQAKVAEAVLSS